MGKDGFARTLNHQTYGKVIAVRSAVRRDVYRLVSGS